MNSDSSIWADLTQWLRHCETHHGDACNVTAAPELPSIRLIEVETRELVDYPSTRGAGYLYLSYVWGDSPQPVRMDGSKATSGPPVLFDAPYLT